MLRPSDPEYKLTRKIKLGRLAIGEKFMTFAIWINKKYNVEILKHGQITSNTTSTIGLAASIFGAQ